MTGFRVGDLLVAGIAISDGVFDTTVVLLVETDESGNVGVVLNRLSDLDLASALPTWAGLVSEPARLFDGGPVSQQGAICLAEPIQPEEEPPGWRPIFGRVGLLNLETPVEIASGAYRRMRIFAGYAGWEAGQLERELELDMWQVVPALIDDVFDTRPESLWRRVLRRQGGDLALLSTWTGNAELN